MRERLIAALPLMRERLIAAPPLDVRKGSAFPLSLFINSGRLCLQSRRVRIVKDSLRDIIACYDPQAPLAEASTIPSSWYTAARLSELEQQTVFSRSWQVAARSDQVREPGQYVTTEIAGEPIVIVRGSDGELRGFFNVCRHHAAAVMTEPEGQATQMRCPYHGWTYSLSGELKGTPDFSGVCNFDRAQNGLAPVEISAWENWVFARLDRGTGERDPRPGSPVEVLGPPVIHAPDARATLQDFLGNDLINQFQNLGLANLHWLER